MDKKKLVYWLAVQPTPYNFYLYNNLKKSDRFDFKFCYSKEKEKRLPFDISHIIFEDDYFFSKKNGIDFNIITKAFNKNNYFVIVGWNDATKVIVMVIRGILGFPYSFWTDSVNVETVKKGNKLVFLFKKWLFKRADVVFTTGNFGVQKMIESGLCVNKLKVISLPFFVSLDVRNKVEEKTVSENIRLLLLARLMKGKGIEDAIEAVHILVQKGIKVELNIAGLGELRDELQKTIGDKNLIKHVNLLGWLDQKSISDYRINSDALIHAVTSHDPFPLVVLESLAQGLPVIGSLLAGSVVDRIKDGYNGYIVAPNKPEIIAQKILNLSNKQLLNSLIINARKSAEEWNGEKVLSIFENAVTKNKI